MSTGTLRTNNREWTILDGTVAFPLRGIWTARASVDADEDDPLPTGTATVILAADNDGAPIELAGTIVDVDVSTFEGRATATLVGGKGLLTRTLLTPRTYQQAPLEVPVSSIVVDAIEEAGELLDDDAAVAGQTVARWHRVGGISAAELLDRLAARFEFNWRLSDDGFVQLFVEEWSEATQDAGFLVEGPEDAVDRTIAGSVARASIRPGTTIRGRRIEEVIYALDENGLRAVCRWGDGTGPGGLRGDFAAATQRAIPQFAYLRTHEVTVRRQNVDDTLDVEADEPDIGGITAVPYYPGIVVCQMNIAEGTRALLVFLGGDETKPAIVAFARLVQNPAAEPIDVAVARVNDTVSVGTLTFTATPDGQGGIATIAVTYAPPLGSPQSVVISPAAPTVIGITGLITSGSPEVFLRGGH